MRRWAWFREGGALAPSGRGPWTGSRDPVLLLAVIVGAVVRLWRFGGLPAGMNQDEAAMAYDAFALIHHGTDRLGYRLPTMLVSWGSGMNPLASYLDAPLVGLFGLTPTVARLPALLTGIASLPLFFLLLRDTLGRRVARVGVILLAISPWHIMLSRWGLEANLFPFVFLLAVVLLLRSLRRPRLLVLAALVFATCLYSYGPSYFVVSVFLAAALAHGLRHRLWPPRSLALAAVVFLIAATPMALNLAVNSLGWAEIRTPFFTVPRMTGMARYRTMGNLGAGFFHRAAENWRIAWDIVRTQDDGEISNTIPGQGVLFWFAPPLALGGLALLCGRALHRRHQPSFFLLVWSAAALLLGALIPVNVNRINILWLPFIAWPAQLVELLARRRALAVLLVLAFGGAFVGFLGAYFGQYERLEAPKFYASFGDALRFAAQEFSGTVCVTRQPEQPYVFVLFYNQEDPRTFSSTVRYAVPDADFHEVLSFGRYSFDLARCGQQAQVVVATRQEAQSFDPAQYDVFYFPPYAVVHRRAPPGGLPAPGL